MAGFWAGCNGGFFHIRSKKLKIVYANVNKTVDNIAIVW